METINFVLGYENLKIYQNDEMFKFSLDSIILSNFVSITESKKKILDIGTGNAIIPIILSTKTDAKITGVELQNESAKLAQKSVKINKLENQIEIMNKDIKDYYNECNSDTYDIIISNPPYFRYSENSNVNESKFKLIARHEYKLNVEDIIKISRKLLKNKGTLSIVHRPERLAEIVTLMKENNLEPKRICFVYPKKGSDANMLLIEGTKNGKPGLKVNDPIYIYENGEYTSELLNYFK